MPEHAHSLLLALLPIVAVAVFWFYRLYRKLHREMSERVRAEQRFRLLVERPHFPSPSPSRKPVWSVSATGSG